MNGRCAQMALAITVALTACKSDYPYQPYARVLTEQSAQCQVVAPSTEANTSRCHTAAEWLAFQGRAAEALALHQRVCRMGDVRSCHVAVAEGRDAEAAWRICADTQYGSVPYCRLGLTAVAAGDPRRAEVLRHYCQRSYQDCTQLLGFELSTDLAAWEGARGLCTGVAPDAAACVALAATPTALGAAVAVMFPRQDCAATAGVVCAAAARRFSDTDPTQVAARAELLERSCRGGGTTACSAAVEFTARQRLRVTCAAGDVAACRDLGAAIVREESPVTGW